MPRPEVVASPVWRDEASPSAAGFCRMNGPLAEQVAVARRPHGRVFKLFRYELQGKDFGCLSPVNVDAACVGDYRDLAVRVCGGVQPVHPSLLSIVNCRGGRHGLDRMRCDGLAEYADVRKDAPRLRWRVGRCSGHGNTFHARKGSFRDDK